MTGRNRLDVYTLPMFKPWNDQKEALGVWGLLDQIGFAELALAFSRLFWPSFIEFRGCVLLEEQFGGEKNFEEWWEKLDGDRQKVEAAINHVHLYDLFSESDTAEVEPVLEELAEILVISWRCALRERFPSRHFRVSVSKPERDYGPTITMRSDN